MVEMLCYDLLIKAELIRFYFSNRHSLMFHLYGKVQSRTYAMMDCIGRYHPKLR